MGRERKQGRSEGRREISCLALGNVGTAFGNQKLSENCNLNLKNTIKEGNFYHPLYHMLCLLNLPDNKQRSNYLYYTHSCSSPSTPTSQYNTKVTGG